MQSAFGGIMIVGVEQWQNFIYLCDAEYLIAFEKSHF
jgi:hypothetical protein